jgi:hypothetical protein
LNDYCYDFIMMLLNKISVIMLWFYCINKLYRYGIQKHWGKSYCFILIELPTEYKIQRNYRQTKSLGEFQKVAKNNYRTFSLTITNGIIVGLSPLKSSRELEKNYRTLPLKIIDHRRNKISSENFGGVWEITGVLKEI